MSAVTADIEQLIIDHDDTLAAYRAAVGAFAKEQGKTNPDPVRVAQLFRRMSELQSQVGDIENDPAFDEPPLS